MHVTETRGRARAALPLALLVAAGIAAALPARASTTIDTTPTWNATGQQNIGGWGEPDTATFGQTITAPANVISLQDFSFYLTNDPGNMGPVSINYKAYVYAWDGTEATGSPLYTSSTTSTGTLGSGFTTLTATPGTAVAVTPGQQYVLFFSTSGVQDGGTQGADFGYVGSDAYAAGQFVYLNSGNDNTQFTVPGGWGTSTDLAYPAGSDLAFKADFAPGGSPAPEPSEAATLSLVALLLALPLAKKALRRMAKNACSQTSPGLVSL